MFSHAHKNTVVAVKWNKNGNWILSAGRDQMLKLFDIRTMREVQSFKGHKKEVTGMFGDVIIALRLIIMHHQLARGIHSMKARW